MSRDTVSNHNLDEVGNLNAGFNVVQTYDAFGGNGYDIWDFWKYFNNYDTEAWKATNGSQHDAFQDTAMSRVKHYLEVADNLGLKVLLTSHNWYQDYSNGGIKLNGESKSDTTVDGVTKGDAIRFINYRDMYTELDSLVDAGSIDNIWGVYLEDDASQDDIDSNTRKARINYSDGHAVLAPNNAVGRIEPDWIENVKDSLDGIYSDYSVKWSYVNNYWWYDYIVPVDTTAHDFTDYYIDGMTILDDGAGTNAGSLSRQILHLDYGINTKTPANDMHGYLLDNSSADSLHLASMYRSLQLGVKGIWFFSYKSMNTSNSWTTAPTRLTTYFKKLALELKDLVNTYDVLPWDPDNTNNVLQSNGWSIPDGDLEWGTEFVGRMPGRDIRAETTHLTASTALVIAVNQSPHTYTDARIYVEERADEQPVSIVKQYENSNSYTQSTIVTHRNINHTETMTPILGIENKYFKDTFLPWDAHVYYVTYDDVSKQGAGNNIPNEFKLEQNFPNPFNPTTEIKYQLPEAQYVKLVIYNILGQEVAQLVDKQQAVGFYSVKWDAAKFASGTYIFRLEAGDFVETKRMVLIK